MILELRNIFLAKKRLLSLEDMIFTRFGTTSDNRGNISSRLCLQKDMKMLKKHFLEEVNVINNNNTDNIATSF